MAQSTKAKRSAAAKKAAVTRQRNKASGAGNEAAQAVKHAASAAGEAAKAVGRAVTSAVKPAPGRPKR